MSLRFTRLDYALKATVELCEIETIAEYIYLYGLSEEDSSQIWKTELKEKEDLLYKTQALIYDEIEQVLISNYGNAFAFFFKLLNDILEIDCIKEFNFNKLTNDVEAHKEMLATKSEDELYPPFGRPLIINTYYLQRYYLFASAAIIYFKNIIESYTKLYNENKLSPNNFTSVQPQIAPPSVSPPLLNSSKEKLKKLRTTLNAEQLLYLFKTLYNAQLISCDDYKDIHQIISSNFKPNTIKSGADLSVSNLGKLWSNIDINNVAFWEDKFVYLHNLAQKDNPLR